MGVSFLKLSGFIAGINKSMRPYTNRLHSLGRGDGRFLEGFSTDAAGQSLWCSIEQIVDRGCFPSREKGSLQGPKIAHFRFDALSAKISHF